MTIYSICNVANPEVGIFDSSDIVDVNGWSVYVSNINPDYKLYYDQESVVKCIYFSDNVLFCDFNIFLEMGNW